MHPCNAYCRFFNQPWVNIVTVVVCVVLSFYGIYAVYRALGEAKKIAYEKQQRREERDREWDFMQYRMKSMIRVAEEWYADTTEAKEFLSKSRRMIEEAKKIDWLPYKAALPVMIVSFLAIVAAPFPQFMAVVLLLATPALIWLVFYIVLWQIKRKIFFAKYLNDKEEAA